MHGVLIPSYHIKTDQVQHAGGHDPGFHPDRPCQRPTRKGCYIKACVEECIDTYNNHVRACFAGLLSGAVLIETIFMWPGIGRYSTKAITSNDFASIMGFTLLVVIVFVLINLTV